MIINGKYYLPPPKDFSDFKEIFEVLVAAGAGRPVDKDGVADGPWTPELLADAISGLAQNDSGVELRTVQLWFQENDRGISRDNIRWLARVFGCGDSDATSEWQAELAAAHRRLIARRKTKRMHPRSGVDQIKTPTETTETELVGQKANKSETKDKRRFNLAQRAEAAFSNRSKLNLPASVWAGCVTLGIVAYVMGVHSVTYSPKDGLEKQVGFFWAPNWTLLELVILPLFLLNVVELLAYWKHRRILLAIRDIPSAPVDDGWARRVDSFTVSHWAVLFICVFIVFALQWSGVHLRALLSRDVGDLMVDWNLIALVRPEIISVTEAIFLSMLAFMYTAAICYLFLTGLVLMFTVAQDFKEVCELRGQQPQGGDANQIAEAGKTLMHYIFRCTILGIWIATCIKLQATFLLSDAENILKWLIADASFALTISDEPSGFLEQRALAHFTSFLLLFSTCCVFSFGYVQILRTLESGTHSNSGSQTIGFSSFPTRTMLGIVGLLIANFLLIGQASGFSLLLIVSVLLSTTSLLNPVFGHKQPARDAKGSF